MTDGRDIRGPAALTRSAALAEPDTETVVTTATSAERAESEDIAVAAPEPTPPQPVAQKSRGPGFFPLLLGGIVAGGIGFAAAFFGFNQQTDPELPQRITGVEEVLDSIVTRLDGFETSLSDLADTVPEEDTETPAAVAALETGIGAVSSDIAALQSTVEGLQNSVTNLSLGGGGEGGPDFAAEFQAQMDAFQAEVDRVTSAAEAEVAAARAEAEATRAAAVAEAEAAKQAAETAEAQIAFQAGLAEVQVALDTGAPFDAALAALEGLDIPAELADVAADGVLPLTELQRTFPDAARKALQAADRGPAEDANALGKVTSFLMSQTNARSLEPREGNSADAVLSRAEAALRSGDLSAALAEIGELGEGPSAALADWLALAQARDAAVSAVSALNQAVDAM
ncbi:MAG: mitofilin family membrane protein [Pseudomonadota bacterium]